jgi:hypothetical protein
MGQDDVHAEAGEQADDALRDGQRLAVAGGVGPGHGDLLALEVLDAAEVVDDVQQVGHALGRMVDVALQVDQRRALLEDAVAVALLTASMKVFCILGVALPMYMSSRMPMTSAMKETMLAVSRTVSPWAIWDFFSSRSCSSRPRRLQADAKEKRVRVELSRKREMPRPELKILVETCCARAGRAGRRPR